MTNKTNNHTYKPLTKIQLALIILLAATNIVTAQINTAAQDSNDVTDQQLQEQMQTLLPEGTKVVNRQARLIHDQTNNRWFLYFLPLDNQNNTISAISSTPLVPDQPDLQDPYSIPIQVLPGKWLTNMINFCGNREDLRVTFRVWGEITVYQNRNYILPTLVAALSIFGEQENQQQTEITAYRQTPQENQQPATTQPPSQQETAQFAAQLRQLLADIPRTEPLATNLELIETTSDTNSQNNQNSQASSLLLDGHMIIDRVGHIAYDPDEQRWMFIFEADAASLAQPPIAVLPSQLLQVMEQAMVSAGTRAIRFRVSGQVTKYNRQNFMLIRKALLVYRSGNLGG